jgi:hypothetical protein
MDVGVFGLKKGLWKANSMIISRLSGGLGNQMFQYALGAILAHKHPTKLELDVSSFTVSYSNIVPRDYGLNVFNIQSSIASEKHLNIYKNPSFLRRLIRKITRHKFMPSRYIYENGLQFHPEILDLTDYVYLDGFWQNERYFNKYADLIRDHFQFTPQMNDKNTTLSQDILSSNAVCIHIRRGDLVSSAASNAFQGLCSLDYYYQAIQIISEQIETPKFYIFSDDPDWVKENLIIECPTIYVDHNTGDQSYEDMRLMSLCKHFIIANSSFSWWGAWLSTYAEKIVIAPKQWFKEEKAGSEIDIIPDSWIKL